MRLWNSGQRKRGRGWTDKNSSDGLVQYHKLTPKLAVVILTQQGHIEVLSHLCWLSILTVKGMVFSNIHKFSITYIGYKRISVYGKNLNGLMKSLGVKFNCVQ